MDRDKYIDARSATKVCPDCGQEKDKNDFCKKYIDSKREIRSMAYCRPCSNKRRVQWRNQGRNREKDREWAKKSAHNYRLSIYGLTQEEFDRLMRECGGRCSICRKKKSLHIDHCHKTGKVRGLLCRSCNHGLGNFNDSKQNLIRAVGYLAR